MCTKNILLRQKINNTEIFDPSYLPHQKRSDTDFFTDRLLGGP